MPDWLGDLLRDWAPYGAAVVFVLGLVGGAITGVWRVLSALFSGKTVITVSRHQAEISFYETKVRSCQEAADRRIAELMKDIADLRADMAREVAYLNKQAEKWETRFWEAQKAGEFLIRRDMRDTPPMGTRRPETGT